VVAALHHHGLLDLPRPGRGHGRRELLDPEIQVADHGATQVGQVRHAIARGENREGEVDSDQRHDEVRARIGHGIGKTINSASGHDIANATATPRIAPEAPRPVGLQEGQPERHCPRAPQAR
jgi:hypothetical protein